MLFGSRPRSTVWSLTKLRIRSPAPARSTSDNATSQTTSVLRSWPRRNPPTTPRPESFSGSAMFFFTVCSAGTSPNTMAVNTATPRLKARTGMFSRISASVGNSPCGMSPFTPTTPAYAKRTSNHGADQREHETLDQQLAHEQPASGSERRADRHLLFARGGTREQHVRDVGARDEEQHAHRREQRVQRRPELPHEAVDPAHHVYGEPRRVVVRVELCDPARHDVHLRGRALERDTASSAWPGRRRSGAASRDRRDRASSASRDRRPAW